MSPLHHFGNWLRECMLQVPLGVAHLLFLMVPVLLLVWILRLPRAQVVPPQRAPRFGENLKIWAALALLLQVLIYLILG